MKQVTFTKQAIQRLPKPLSGMQTYSDTKEKGLRLYVTAGGAVTFFVRKRIRGRDERVILGSFPEMTVEQARATALQTRAAIAGGANPNQDKTKLRQEITFKELFVEYMERYSKPHKRSWQFDEREVNKYLSHWFSRKVSSITKQEVAKLHDKIGTENGLYQANRVLERIRAMFNKAIEWGWEGVNPSLGIKKFKEKARDRFLQSDELQRFHAALAQEKNETARDYILMSLLTGARKSNVLAMQWEEISWPRAEWRIAETKNGESVTVPLLPAAMEILERRRKATNSIWVFPSDRTTGHYADPKKAWQRLLKESCIGDLRIHDIRRTLGSYQAITGASLPIIGKSLGHKSQAATAIYSRLNLDPVRQSLVRATDVIFANEMPSKNAVDNKG